MASLRSICTMCLKSQPNLSFIVRDEKVKKKIRICFETCLDGICEKILCRYIALFVFLSSLQDIDRMFGSCIWTWYAQNKHNKTRWKIDQITTKNIYSGQRYYELYCIWNINVMLRCERKSDHKQMGESQGKSENHFHYSLPWFQFNSPIPTLITSMECSHEFNSAFQTYHNIQYWLLLAHIRFVVIFGFYITVVIQYEYNMIIITCAWVIVLRLHVWVRWVCKSGPLQLSILISIFINWGWKMLLIWLFCRWIIFFSAAISTRDTQPTKWFCQET